MKKNPFIILLFLLLLSQSGYSQNFSKESILADLEYLLQSLEQTHCNLYAYTDKDTFLNNYLEVKQSINEDSLNLLQATSLFQKVISKANTGHAEIDFPALSYRGYAMNGGTVFPLEIALENEKALIRKNFSGNKKLEPGLEIIAIDDEPIQEILNKIYPHLSAETTYFKHAKLEFWSFPRLYWQVYGQQDTFNITIKNEENIEEVKVSAVDLINDFELKRTDIISANQSFQFYEEVAYLQPGNFSGDEEAFKIFIDSAFTAINTKNPPNLIIDLRNNAGGHNAFSDYMVSYFANVPFKWHSKFTLKTSQLLKEQTQLNNDTTDTYFKNILARENGEIYEYQFEDYEPLEENKRFKGNVYILIHRHSYSMAAVTAAMIQDYSFATLVGEETGDLPTLYASQFQYSLPNTGIIVKVPKGYIIRPNGKEEKRGVVPDIEIKDHLVDEKDEILEELLKMLEE